MADIDNTEREDDVFMKELMGKVNKGDLLERLKTKPEWKILKEIADAIVERAVYKFAVCAKADDLRTIIELQVIIKKYKYALFGEIEQFIEEGNKAFDVLHDNC